ncbi:MAG: dihydroxyacetone kinase subunit DhaK [Sphaerochaetaceae bacterium]|nr:dihydroxyacetone kinase subunit DhaK [Sphaerochaetaceae bacterium]
MNKLINEKDKIVQEMVEGYILSHNNKVVIKGENNNLLCRKYKKKDKVGLVIGNGSGHEPCMIDLVGFGLLDVNVIGEVFTAPTPYQLLEALKEADCGKGVLLLVSSHAGDILNAKMALMLAKLENITVKMFVFYDDIASAPKGKEKERRGTAGLFYTLKIVGAACERGYSLSKCYALAEDVRDNTRTIACALHSGTNPITNKSMFNLNADEINIGLGVHGEAGQKIQVFENAKSTVYQMASSLVDDLPFKEEDKIFAMINNSGSTTYSELMICYKELFKFLKDKNIEIIRNFVGTYVTVQETHGISIVFCKATCEMIELYDDRADSYLFN